MDICPKLMENFATCSRYELLSTLGYKLNVNVENPGILLELNCPITQPIRQEMGPYFKQLNRINFRLYYQSPRRQLQESRLVSVLNYLVLSAIFEMESGMVFVFGVYGRRMLGMNFGGMKRMVMCVASGGGGGGASSSATGGGDDGATDGGDDGASSGVTGGSSSAGGASSSATGSSSIVGKSGSTNITTIMLNNIINIANISKHLPNTSLVPQISKSRKKPKISQPCLCFLTHCPAQTQRELPNLSSL